MTISTVVPLDFDCAALSDMGRVRDHNEDSFLSLPENGLWAVADGMGGHSAGDFASAVIVREMASVGVPVSAQDQRIRVLERLDRAHAQIQSHAARLGSQIVGSTVAALLVHDGEMTCIWAGDSRIYLLRDGALNRLTQDHSEVARLVAAGFLTEDEARHDPRRNVITSAVGIGNRPGTELATAIAQPGDVLLLCSDGLTEHVKDMEIATVLAGAGGGADMAAQLISMTLDRGAKDNVTVVVVRFLSADNASEECD
ncbi:MAG: protein phosphatase 2C domain-containing protein [Paracoccus sp. (in: a-proteobacteria)]|uniref:PP2C family protein-serine/threonine phosphatase n=1 Tax=Paracoccus sp. TaxID=267 RepID=UPI0026DFBA7D|nr:protein phosphatase 2C domain-containing protein [Paracoccus sp. (in: a-proteobacteria)]MDO5622789.1 protein phosphatase 2C domain-containing protein [Paracoccus sp. (in: a-proteobacteria)]